jgi:DNA ligase-1
MIKKLQTLYKIDTQGRLREWTMNVDGNKFYAIKGLVDGKKTQDKPTTCVAKNVGRANETTPNAQADFEAQAKFTKKLKSGYALTEEDAKVKKFYEAMLADKFSDRKDSLSFPIYSQRKLDGIRCIARLEDGEVVGKTRNGKVIECIPHITDSLKGFFTAFPDAVLDGELYNHDYRDNFNKITSLVRKQIPVKSDKMTDKAFAKKVTEFENRLEEAKESIQYWIYDMPHLSDEVNESTIFSARLAMLKHHLFEAVNKDCLVLVETAEINSFKTLDDLYARYLEEGYEGQMVRANAPYENKRSKGLLKRKEFMDAEYKVIGIDEGNGNRAGTVKHLVCYCDKTQQQFNSNVKGSFDYLKEVLDNKDYYIGKLATIKFFQLTPDGIPRFPYAIAFRDYE